MCNRDKRVIVLVDMDCFYVQVEQRLQPEFRGKPCAVVQYKPWRGGSIVAVSYEAREYGVKRGQFGDDAKELCPECHLFRIPEKRGKGDLCRYREAGAEVIRALSVYTDWIERASVDEAYLDITDLVREKGESDNLREELSSSHVATYKSRRGSKKWFDSEVSREDRDLAVGAIIVSEMRKHIFEQTQFICSAGIARNKSLAKLACALRKPDGQTILPHSCVQTLFQEIPVEKIPNLGGKLGSKVIERLGVKFMSEVYDVGRDRLRELFSEKEGDYIFELSEGTHYDAVRRRQLTKSLSCGKNFLGPETLKCPEKVKYWMKQMLLEILERATDDRLINKRRPQTISLYFRPDETKHGITRAAPFSVNCADRLTEVCWLAMTRDKVSPRLLKGKPEENELWKAIGVSSITSIGMSACNFISVTDNSVQNTLKFSCTNNDMKETDEDPIPPETESATDTNSISFLQPTNSNSIPNFSKYNYFRDDTPSHPDAAVHALRDDITANYFAMCPLTDKALKAHHPSNNPKTDAAAFLQSIPYSKTASVAHLPSLSDYDPNSNSDYIPFNYKTNLLLTARGIDVPTMHALPLDLQNDILAELEENARLNRYRALELDDYNSSSNSSLGFAAPRKDPLIKCVSCGELVPRPMLQEHKDHHFATNIQSISEFANSTRLPAAAGTKKRKSSGTEDTDSHKKNRGRKKMSEKTISCPSGQTKLSMFLNRPSTS